MNKKMLVGAYGALVMAGAAQASLSFSVTDTTLSGAAIDNVQGAGEYGSGLYNYTGGGSGFGGTLGNGTIWMDSDLSNLQIAFQPGNNLNDVMVVYLDTKAGGVTDAMMNDQADGGRRAVSNLSLNVDDAFPILPDYAVVFGNFGIVLFELTAGNTDGHLNFLNFEANGGSGPTFREYNIPLATLGMTAGGSVDWFAAYCSESGFNSNESMPAGAINGGANPGFDGPSAGYSNHNRFTTVPTPGAMTLLGVAGLLVARRRRN